MNGYRVTRSKRRTAAVQVTRGCEVLVRAPLAMPDKEIEKFVARSQKWIEKAVARQKRYSEAFREPTEDEILRLKAAAADLLPRRTEYFSALTGLVPAGIRITEARTRFGSCSGKNRICFSCFLMTYPPEAVDYVVLHELAHIKHHNHGRRFWELVEKYMPDWAERRKLLKDPPGYVPAAGRDKDK